MRINNHTRKKQRGVSLIEVLIALLITAIGVLGLAKMQALTVANSQVSGLRGLVALQASSLAALMHSNKGYWQVAGTLTPNCQGTNSCVMTGTTISGTFGTAPTSCLNTNLCGTTPMAAWDMTQWLSQMNALAPTHTTTIDCSGAGTTTLPVVCEIKITWLEKQTGGGTATASLAAATPAVTQAYYLYVQP